MKSTATWSFCLGKFARKVRAYRYVKARMDKAHIAAPSWWGGPTLNISVFLSLTLAVANFFQVSKRLKLNTRRLLVRTLVGNIHSTLPHFINAIPAFHSFHKFYNKSNNITIQDRREINNAVSVEADVWERGKRYSLKYFVHLNGKKFTIGFFL